MPRVLRSQNEDEVTDENNEARDLFRLPASAPPSAYAPSHLTRPQSSLSFRRYRTPMASMHMSPPPVSMSVPPAQPMPAYDTPSAYAGHVATTGPASVYPASYTGEYSQSRTDLISTPPSQYPIHASEQASYSSANRQQYARPFPLQAELSERTYAGNEDLQLRLRVLEERLERLEITLPRSTSSLLASGRGRSPRGSTSPHGGHDGPWALEHMGMWSIVLDPLSSLVTRFRQLMDFIAFNPDRSPGLLIIRRLFLDITFLLCLLTVFKLTWSKSGIRRKEVLHALKGVWWAIAGHRKPRVLIDKAV